MKNYIELQIGVFFFFGFSVAAVNAGQLDGWGVDDGHSSAACATYISPRDKGRASGQDQKQLQRDLLDSCCSNVGQAEVKPSSSRPPAPLTSHKFFDEFFALKGAQKYGEAFNFGKNFLVYPLEVEVRNKILLMMAEMGVLRQTDCFSDDVNYKILDICGSHPKAPAEWQVAALFYKAVLGFKRRTNLINDDEAFCLFQEVAQHKVSSSYVQLQAVLYRAKMGIKNRAATYDDPLTFNLLKEIKDHYFLNPKTGISACYYMAWMRLHGRTAELDLDEVFDFMDKVSRNTHASLKMQAKAQYYKAVMGVTYATKLIDDEGALQLLDGLIINDNITEVLRLRVRYLYAIMCLNYRADSLNDKKAFLIFDDLSSHSGLLEQVRSECKLAKAIMRYHERTENICDVEAVSIMRSLFNAKMDPPFLTDVAKYYTALMYSENRAPSITKNDVLMLLWPSCRAESVPDWLRKDCSRVFYSFLKKTLDLPTPANENNVREAAQRGLLGQFKAD